MGEEQVRAAAGVGPGRGAGRRRAGDELDRVAGIRVRGRHGAADRDDRAEEGERDQEQHDKRPEEERLEVRRRGAETHDP